ncbi:MAG TPA: hypothetical protein VJ841_04070 [Candidatus Saccharimonadales bacterium]|nr:hypothetical protein [Candidatus Saccharimonadales bacterium]
MKQIQEPRILATMRLGDLGLGNEKGIPSSLASANTEQIRAYAQKMLQAIVRVTDHTCFSCIDGRFCMHNFDKGVAKAIRRSLIGGSEQAVETALNAGVIEPVGPMPEVILKAEKIAGFGRSSHQGGCGGANGAVEDAQAVVGKKELFGATEALMSIPEIQVYTKLSYDAKTANGVRNRAAKTAEFMTQGDWVGQKYVDGIAKGKFAGNVEVLKTNDSTFHGHEEPAVVIIFSVSGLMTISKDEADSLGLGRPFVWNLDGSLDVATNMNKEKPGTKRAAFMANIAKHLSGADRLATPKTPVIIILAP